MKKLFQFDDISFWQLIRPTICLCVTVTFPRMHLDYLIAKSAFSRIVTSRTVLVLPFDHTPNYRSILAAAKRTGLKSIVLQHGILGLTNLYENIHSDFYAAWGEYALEWFRKRGKDFSKVRITGSPRYDIEFGALDINSPVFSREVKKTVLVLTEGGDSLTAGATEAEDIQMIEAVTEGFIQAGLIDVRIIIKPHPRQRTKFIHDIVMKYMHMGLDISVTSENMKTLLQKADVCVSGYSTTLLEAMFYRKPAIVFDRYFQTEWVPFTFFGAALKASDPDEMATALKLLLNQTQKRQQIIGNHASFVKYAAGSVDGLASQRVIKFINDIISETLSPEPGENN